MVTVNGGECIEGVAGLQGSCVWVWRVFVLQALEAVMGARVALLAVGGVWLLGSRPWTPSYRLCTSGKRYVTHGPGPPIGPRGVRVGLCGCGVVFLSCRRWMPSWARHGFREFTEVFKQLEWLGTKLLLTSAHV